MKQMTDKNAEKMEDNDNLQEVIFLICCVLKSQSETSLSNCYN